MLSNLPHARLKLLQKEQFKKTAEATGDLTDNKFAGKITKVLKTSAHKKSETVTNEEERYISRRKTIIDDLRLI